MALSDTQRRHFQTRSSGQWYSHTTVDQLYPEKGKPEEADLTSHTAPPRAMWPRADRSPRIRSPRQHPRQDLLPLFKKRLEEFEGQDQGEFSAHANRHSLENHGVFLDQPMGRRKRIYNRWQHKSASDSLAWNPAVEDRDVFATHSQLDYTNTGMQPNTHTLQAKHRRYPRTIPLDEVAQGPTKPSTSTTEWLADDFQTSLAVLSKTQEPRLCPNIWRYSTHRYNT